MKIDIEEVYDLSILAISNHSNSIT